jgi:DNA repair exonuclease SbcCD ATPase subunit
MKNLIIIVVVALSLNACSNKEAEEKIKLLEKEKAELLTQSEEKEKFVAEVIASLSEIQTSVNAIGDNQNRISIITNDVEKQGIEGAKEKKNQIISDLTVIDKKLAENKKAISSLSKKVKDYKGKVEGLEKLVSNLQQTVEIKEREITTLKQEVARLNIEVASLQTTVEEKDKALKTAYYIVGTDEELDQKGIYKNKGGFVGIGRTAVLSDNLDLTQFKKIDVESTRDIQIQKKSDGTEVKVLTTHPKESYELLSVGKTATIRIKDPQKFWEKSKALVVMLD